MRSLSSSLGVEAMSLYAHFASKEALQVAILDHEVERFVAMVVAPALKERRGEPRVRALLRRWLEWSRAEFMPGGCVFVASIAELDDRPGPVRDRLAASQRDWLDTLTTAIRIGVDERHFAADTDARQVAWEILSLTYGTHLLSRLLRERGAETRHSAAVERILQGIRR